jgi:hypothetical protein
LVSLVIVTLYYLLLNLGLEFSRGGTVNPVLGTWMPNGVMGALAFYLFYNTVKEKPDPFSLLYTKNIAPFCSRAAGHAIDRFSRRKN